MRRLRLLHRIGDGHVIEFGNEPRGLEALADVIALFVGIRINLVGDVVVALVSIKPMSCVPAPTQTVWPPTVNGAFHSRKWCRDATTRTGSPCAYP